MARSYMTGTLVKIRLGVTRPAPFGHRAQSKCRCPRCPRSMSDGRTARRASEASIFTSDAPSATGGIIAGARLFYSANWSSSACTSWS
jgi:hypothetical protein